MGYCISNDVVWCSDGLVTFLLQSQYHPYCTIQWGNTTSEQNCWLGDTNVTLPDVNTQDPTVVSAYTSWIQALVKEFNIDGLRIDGKQYQKIAACGEIHGILINLPIFILQRRSEHVVGLNIAQYTDHTVQTRKHRLLAEVLRSCRCVLYWGGV